MGTQTMGSQGGAVQEAKAVSLSRQGSLYSLTLDEVQNQLGDLGKPLGSLNLDELLKSVWNAEANQATGIGIDNNAGQLSSGSSLHRQGSLTFSSDIGNKTVDEVWRDIQQNKNSNQERKAREKQATLGEMTLEDFLKKAGVVAESPLGIDVIAVPQQSIPQHAPWMQYQLPSVQQQQHQHQQQMMAVFMPENPIQQPVPVIANPLLDAAYTDTQRTISPSSLISTLSDTQAPGRKRVAPGDVVEKTVERRQKRMIKNRESAARSRARRQAYTHELEHKVSHLEAENERLRRQKEVEKVLPSAPPPEPKYQLRRTHSAPF